MPRRKHSAASSTRQSRGGAIELGFGFEQYFGLVAAGLFATLPLTSCLTVLGMAFGAVVDRAFGGGVRIGSGSSDLLGIVLGIPVVAALFSVPAVVACRILRARQPNGVRIAWDEMGVAEWDGTWPRAVVSWEHLEAAHVRWGEGRLTREALQLVDSETHACITVWQGPPARASLVRRRLTSEKVGQLREALEARGVPLTHHPDWSRARDADREQPLLNRWLGRIGYPMAVVAPILAMPSSVGAVVVAAFGAALLVFRALPVLAEIKAIRARLAARVDDTRSENEVARVVADRAKLRAARLEAFVRVGFVVLLLAATLVAALFHPWDRDARARLSDPETPRLAA